MPGESPAGRYAAVAFSQTGQRVFGDQLQNASAGQFPRRPDPVRPRHRSHLCAGFELVWRDRRHHLHGAEWAGDDAGFTADALLRIDPHAVVNMRDRAVPDSYVWAQGASSRNGDM